MKINTLKKILLAGISAAALSACTTYHDSEKLAYSSDSEQTGATSHAVAEQADFAKNKQNAVAENVFDNPKDIQQQAADLKNINTYYFELDSFALTDRAAKSLLAHSKYLVNHPDAHVRLEGHTDERGSREYNITLGEHRAQAVKNYLQAHGAKPSQIDIVSFGKEKPADLGHNEHAWQMNRRAIINYEHS